MNILFDNVANFTIDRNRGTILSHAVELIDFVLDEQSSTITDRRYTSPLIDKLIELDEDTAAIELAERHYDMIALIRIAEKRGDVERHRMLADWKAKYANRNFANILYQYYIDNGM